MRGDELGFVCVTGCGSMAGTTGGIVEGTVVGMVVFGVS
jgi:hypothetical protein